jgi:hypothetical protein
MNQSGSPQGMIAAFRAADGRSKAVIIVSLLLVVFAYFPTLQFDYVTQDQWRAFRYSTESGLALDRGQACTNMISGFYVLTGRPFVWMTECIEHAAVARISDFAVLRPIGLTITLTTVMYLGFVLAPILGGLAFGILGASAFVLTPAYSFMYLQGMPAALVLVTPILAAASFRTYSQRNHEPGGKLKAGAISFLLFVLACLIYPAYALIVLPLALLEFGFNLSETLSNRLRKLVETLTFYFGASLFYYALVKTMVFFYASTAGNLPDLGAYEVAMQLGPSALLRQVTTAAIYFFRMPPLNFSAPVASTLMILVAFSCGLGWLTGRSESGRVNSVLAISFLFLFISAVILLGSISPWLFSKTDGVSARHVLAWNLFFCAAMVGLISLLLRNYSVTARSAAVVLLLGGFLPLAWVQNRQSTLEVVATGEEIQLMRDKLSDWVEKKGWLDRRYLLVVLPTVGRPLNIEKSVSPRFGNDNAVLASSQNPVSIPWMINALLREHDEYPGVQVDSCGFDQSCASHLLLNPNSVVVGYSYGAAPISAAAEPFVINFSLLTTAPVTPSVTVIRTSASSVLDPYGPEGLFWSVEPGWHAVRNPSYPQTLNVDFGESRSFSEVSFEAQDGLPQRMPKEVRIKTSGNGTDWTQMASASNLCAWDGPRSRVKISQSVQAKFLRVEILSNCGDPDFLTLKGLAVE